MELIIQNKYFKIVLDNTRLTAVQYEIYYCTKFIQVSVQVLIYHVFIFVL